MRYYEEIGLIAPGRNQSSQYRTFDDVSRLMAIDYYKKRDFVPLEIKELIGIGEYNGLGMLSQKIGEIENNIRAQQRIVKRLAETKAFCACGCRSDSFTI